MYRVDNAIILAAGISSRFAPLSYEKPKALITVKGEVLIERQIRQIREAGIPEIIIVTGYKKEQFEYLKEKEHVRLIENPEYSTRNNNGSIFAARNYLHNSYICSADNYFSRNVFENEVDESYYAALYAEGRTEEWCMEEDSQGFISSVRIGGENSWYMMGHVFWSHQFSRQFLHILREEYEKPETREKLWENIFAEHLTELPMKIRRYSVEDIYEFDSLEELREFDKSYLVSSGSVILQKIAEYLGCRESELKKIIPLKNQKGEVTGFQFQSPEGTHQYEYGTGKLV